MPNNLAQNPRSLAEDAVPGVAIIGLDHRFLFANPALCKMLKYTPAELIGRSFEAVSHPEEIPLDEQISQRRQGEPEQYEFQKRCIEKSGAQISMRMTASTIRDRGGRTLYYVLLIEPLHQLPINPSRSPATAASVPDLERIRKAILM